MLSSAATSRSRNGSASSGSQGARSRVALRALLCVLGLLGVSTTACHAAAQQPSTAGAEELRRADGAAGGSVTAHMHGTHAHGPERLWPDGEAAADVQDATSGEGEVRSEGGAGEGAGDGERASSLPTAQASVHWQVSLCPQLATKCSCMHGVHAPGATGRMHGILRTPRCAPRPPCTSAHHADSSVL